MIINELVLYNYGIYYGENKIDFSVNDINKNIILIGGENGAGKTTMLESIKLAIYGCFFYGVKNPNNKYYENIYFKFNNKAKAENKNKSYIKLDFNWTENNKTDNYVIKRTWDFNNKSEDISSKVLESIHITKNEEILDSKSVEDVESYFRKVFPQKLFDFFFFDGEDIKRLLSDEFLDKDFKSAVYTLFDIDMFKSLDDDLNNYLRLRSRQLNLTSDEEEYFNRKTLIDKLQEKYESNEKFKTDKEIEKNKIKSIVQSLDKKFQNAGGEFYNKISSIESDIKKLESEKININEDLKNMVGNLMPFYINRRSLEKITEQLKKESNSKEYEIFKNRIDDGTIDKILKSSFGKEKENSISEFKALLLDELSNTKVKALHYLSYDDSEKVKNISEKDIPEIENKVEYGFSVIKRVNEELPLLRETLSKVKNNKDIEQMLKEISVENMKLGALENEIETLVQLIKYEKDEYEIAKKELLILKDKVIKNKKDANKFNVINKVQNVLEKYIIKVNEDKLEKVRIEFLQIFRSLHRKEDYISDIKINKESMKIDLYHKHGLMDKRLLSSGEKQVYILSLLFALLKVSNKEVPVVFDTLLGRLDSSHRGNIIQKYLPKVSNQVIILATETEITKENYKLLKKHIAREYTIDFDINENRIDILNTFFK